PCPTAILRPNDSAIKNILLAPPLEETAPRPLRDLPGVTVHALPARRPDEPVVPELLRGKQVLFCKIPPKNLDDLTDLELMQLVTVGYEHLRHLGLADRPVRVCNARGLFDTSTPA